MIGVVFFVLGIITLPDYGINWDEINHLPRGQAYLNYFLTGKKDFSNLPPAERYWQDPDSLAIDTDIEGNEVSGRSYWQLDVMPFTWFMERDGGHPPLSDILSSVFNRVLFGKLRLINDIDSYRVYGIFLASLLAGFIYYKVTSRYGKLAGLVSFLSLSLYPLFWAESHFNTEKDIPEAVYWSFFLYTFWKGIVEKKPKWILFAGLLGGLALGTKFNILFSIFVIIPWFLIYLLINKKPKRLIRNFLSKKKLIASVITAPFISLAIFIGSWPYLWPDVIVRINKIIGYYKVIGTTAVAGGFSAGPFGINTYPLIWILFTTPVVILILSTLGVFNSIRLTYKKKDNFAPLVLLWFIIPIARVAWPGATIYGGVRQIMEYIPAMAILSGLGAKWLQEKLVDKAIPSKIASFLIIIPFLFLIQTLIRIHPNENAYFNPLIGGLSGAKEKEISAWGNTFGAAYRQAVSWVNKNAEENAKFVLVYELMPNVPPLWIRPDITYTNTLKSGFLKEGEYATTLTFDGTAGRSYNDIYFEKFIEPVYEAKVDGVSVIKVWKNDTVHTKSEYLKTDKVGRARLTRLDDGFEIDLNDSYYLSHLKLEYREGACSKLVLATVEISENGQKWSTRKETLPSGAIPFIGTQPIKGSLTYPFLAEKARFIRFTVNPEDACFLNVSNFKVFQFSDLK